MKWLVCLLALAACGPWPQQGSPIPPLTITQDSAELAPYLKDGVAEIHGQAFLTTRGGDVKLAAGRLVTLDPATTFTREWFTRFGAIARWFGVAPRENELERGRRTTVADAEGRFRFRAIPPGTYLVRSTVTWETGGRYDPVQGGVVAAFITIRDDEDKRDLILNEYVEMRQ